MRRDAQRDENEPAIVRALEDDAIEVYRKLPVDLLVRCPTWPPGIFMCQEVKTLTAKPRKDQLEQQEFCRRTGTPIVRTPEQALAEVLIRRFR